MSFRRVSFGLLLGWSVSAACSAPGGGITTVTGGANAAGTMPTGVAGAAGTGPATTTGMGGNAPVGTAGGAAGNPVASGAGAAGTPPMNVAGAAGTPPVNAGAGGMAPTAGAPAAGTSAAGMDSGGGASAGTTAGGNGAGGSGAVTPVEPVAAGTVYTFTMGASVFKVDAGHGGRITSFTLDGEEMIASEAVTGNETNWGSTFWTAPQNGDAGWGWPPLTPFDSDAYTAAVADGKLTLTGSPATGDFAGISINKVFSATSDGVVTVEYQIVNGSAAAVDMAHWEITRVATGGISFYATGTGTPDIPGPLVVTEMGGVTYLDTIGTPGVGEKHIGDGAEGWIAHADGDLLLLKAYPDVAADDFAFEEGDAEFYSDVAYVEVENQGALVPIAAGEMASWTVKWALRRLPAPAAVGDAAMLEFVRANLP